MEKNKLPNFFASMYNSPDGHKIVREFQKFLMNKGSWCDYLYNLKEKGFGLQPKEPRAFIISAFLWGGINNNIKWSEIHEEWCLLCDKKNFESVMKNPSN